MIPAAHLLVVEDDPDHRRLLQGILASNGYRVAAFASVAEALPIVRTRFFDLALLDLHVGDENGLAVAEAVRRHSPYTAIVILTGQGDLESAVRSIDLQIQTYLLKPVHADELQRCVAEQIAAMREKRQRDSLAAHMQAAVHSLHISDGAHPSPSALTSGPLTMDLGHVQAIYQGREIDLTTSELDAGPRGGRGRRWTMRRARWKRLNRSRTTSPDCARRWKRTHIIRVTSSPCVIRGICGGHKATANLLPPTVTLSHQRMC